MKYVVISLIEYFKYLKKISRKLNNKKEFILGPLLIFINDNNSSTSPKMKKKNLIC